jgi:hypothetical protein
MAKKVMLDDLPFVYARFYLKLRNQDEWKKSDLGKFAQGFRLNKSETASLLKELKDWGFIKIGKKTIRVNL